jgi:uncharacterized membrane protein
MKRLIIHLLLLLFPVLGIVMRITSCSHDALIEDIPEVCFERDVLPVFQNSCGISGCHDDNGESALVLNSYVSVSHAIVPGKPYSSEIYKAIIAKSEDDRMPPGNPLPLEKRTLIRLWIEQGARLTICSDQAGPPVNEEPGYINPRACFSRDVLPVLISRCASTGCHDAITHEEDYIFSSFSSTLEAVKPGIPNDSKLYEVITAAPGEDRMPPEGEPQLTTAEIDSIRAWISYGALNEFCGELCDTVGPVTFSATIWPAVQKSCTGCHSGTAPSGGILISGYSDLFTLASDGRLIKSLRGIGLTRMPPGNPFTECRIRQFEIWTDQGALNN